MYPVSYSGFSKQVWLMLIYTTYMVTWWGCYQVPELIDKAITKNDKNIYINRIYRISHIAYRIGVVVR